MAWLLIAVVSFSPIGLHAQSGAVLCIESDGHFAIELAAGTRCTQDDAVARALEDAAQEQNDHEHFSDGETHCNDCIDVVLRSGTDEDCVAVAAPTTSLRAPAQKVAQDLIPVQHVVQGSKSNDGPGILSASDPISILSTVIFLT